MPVLPEVDSTITFLPGSISPSASAASIMAKPIRSLTLPAGLYASSFPINSAPQLGATRVSRTIGVLPTRAARLSGIARVGGETLIRRPRVPARRALLAEGDARNADDGRALRLRADPEHDPMPVPALGRHDERQAEHLVRVVLDLGVRELV